MMVIVPVANMVAVIMKKSSIMMKGGHWRLRKPINKPIIIVIFKVKIKMRWRHLEGWQRIPRKTRRVFS